MPILRFAFRMVKASLLMLVCGYLIQPQNVHAIAIDSPSVKLIAPEAIREVLAMYFELPAVLLKDESERVAFIHRAQSEIPELLATEGFFSSKTVLRSMSPEGLLEMEVISGPRTVVSELNIEFRGDLSLPEALRIERVKNLRAAWTLVLGKPFRAAAWDEAKAALLAQVAREDYAAARIVESNAQVDIAKAGASLHIVVDSGQRFQFGELQVSGLVRYEEILVTRYATFKRSQPYQRDLLLSFQSQLQNLPQFSSVIVTLDTTHENFHADADQAVMVAPILVQIVEAQSRKISVGVGYSTNNGVRNEINYQSYNFMDQTWTLNSAAIYEQNRQTISIGVDTPPNPLGYHLTWNSSGEKTQIQGLDTRRDKLGVTHSRTLFDIESGTGLYWQQEQRFPLGGIRETDQALVLDWHWNRRTVDNPLFPTSGALTELRLGGASKAILSDQDFVRSYFRHQTWIPLGERDVVSLRFEGGYTASISRLSIPQEYLFRVGGTQTVRGFAYQSLGFQEGNAVVGGRVMTTASAEHTHWFSGWGIALFSDVGGAADIAPDLHMALGYGTGIRWRSPVGPLALDFARGKDQPGSRMHFSIIVAF